MSTVTSTTVIQQFSAEQFVDESTIAAAAFLARYGARTLDAYRFDLRTFFQWANNVGLTILEATRPHIELYRVSLEERGLAASTIDK